MRRSQIGIEGGGVRAGNSGLLTAVWRNIAFVNYTADPAVLAPFVPDGIELDLWKGQAFVSIVGLLFERVKLLGIPVPFYRRFEQVNLRLYVRRQTAERGRSGVIFIREIVPYRSMATVARLIYGQNYV